MLQAKVFSFCTCFLSAGSPASSPAKSRLVEALCIHLCTEITQPRRQSTLSGQCMYASRYKLILQAYNRVRQRLLNSEALLDRTNLTLFVINEHTLTKWYKSRVRREEVTTLLQGVALPPTPLTTPGLPDPQQKPSSPAPPPEIPHVFVDLEDTSGQARPRDSSSGT